MVRAYSRTPEGQFESSEGRELKRLLYELATHVVRGNLAPEQAVSFIGDATV